VVVTKSARYARYIFGRKRANLLRGNDTVPSTRMWTFQM